jgi:hypothetical protein
MAPAVVAEVVARMVWDEEKLTLLRCFLATPSLQQPIATGGMCRGLHQVVVALEAVKRLFYALQLDTCTKL